MRFVLEIDLGNEAMESAADVRRALAHVAGTLHSPEAWTEYDTATHPIRDDNGNRVGQWMVTK